MKRYCNRSVFGFALAITLGVVMGWTKASADDGSQHSGARAVEMQPDWEATEALRMLPVVGGEDVPPEVVAQQIATHEIGKALAQNRVSVLVYLDPAPARGVNARQNVRQFTIQRQGVVKYEYDVVLPNVINLRNIPRDQLDALAAMPGVVKVELDEYFPNLARLHDSTPRINALQSQIAGAGLSADGSGVRICIADTGIDSDHLMYADRIDTAAGHDFYNDDNNPEDDNGHGSHVSGIAAGGTGLSVDFGCGAGSQPFQGVAPGATLIGVKILNSSGGGFSSDIVAGINYCADQSPSGARADVINLSIGTGNFTGNCTHAWAVAGNNAVANGVVVVAASGNENNSNSMGSPACGANVIAVGATWKADYPTCEDNLTNWNWGICVDNSPNADDVGCFSNESDLLDVTAPGLNIWSASNAAGGGSIVGMSGTSMASPQVAGLAALILSADPSLTPTEVRQIIRDGAVDLGPAGFDRAYGWGRIDAIASLQLVGGGCTGDGDCDDGLFCNGAETCNAGTCVAGTPPNCNDGVACTDDSCNEGTDSCDNLANDANCDNGQFCDGAETCHPTLDCQVGTAPDCDDGVGCTNDSCNEGTDSCDNVANNANCDDGVFCNGAETCHPTLDCQSGSDPCPGQICDEGGDTCIDCSGDPDCDDGIYCNGAESCSGGTCQPGTPVNCDDGVACTDDSCNEGTDSCDNVANDANCDNGLYCDGAETCSATLGCQAGTAVDCDDGVACTDDSCNEGTDSCDNVPNDAVCNNGQFCDGAETCSATLGCQAGTSVDCDDGVGCTDDSCNEATDTCDNTPNDANCPDDGQFCNGTEFCHANNDCSSTGDPCGGLSCNESTDTCESVECTVPGDCDDGNACTTDDCVGNVCVNDCPGAVTSYPYSEDFESGLGAWSNVGGDVFDWTRDANGTPSSNTGPSGDHTTGSGFYMYIETSSPRSQGDYAIFESPCIDLSGTSTADLSFWYHMYGSTIDTLDVEVSDDCTSWTNVWSLSGNQGNSWFQANVNLDAYAGSVIRVRFVGTRGSSYTGDIAIDDIAVDASGIPCSSDPECDDSDACTVDACVGNVCQNTPIFCDDGSACTIDSCSGGVCSNDCPVTVDSFPDSENFEAGFGDWSNTDTDDIDWTRNSGGTPSSGTGPSGDHTTGSGWYMYVEASSPNYPSMTAILDGPCVDLTGSSSAGLSFWYHMLGSAVGTLYLEASDDCTSWTPVWSLSGNQGSAWQQANVDLSAYAGSVVSLRYRGITGSSYQGDMCIDDLQIDATGGPQCTVPGDCDDGLYCNGAEDCVSGSCVAGTPIDCDDGVACTDNSCNESSDSCDNIANDANCDNGQFCDGPETCNAALGCQAGAPVDCDDGVGCTDDSCNEGTDSCVNTPNDANCPDDGLFCDGDEYCDAAADCSSTGDPCTGGQVCNESTDTCEGGGALLEAGSLSVGGSPVTVNLTNSYASPVIVCSINYNNNTTPVVTRVSNVTSNSFDVRLQNPSGGGVATENVSCLVVEEGVWTIDGVNIEAQRYTSTVTDQNNSWVGELQSYGQSYTNPVILGQVMSELDPEWSVFWCRGNTQTNPPSSSVLRTGKTVCEDTLVPRADETIGFIVIEAGHGTIGGVEYEAALGADSVLGVTNNPPYSYNYSPAFGSAPSVAVVTMAAMDGGNGGWAYTYGPTPTTATQLRMAIDEDQIADSERNHVNEQVGYIVFESNVVYP